jgi:carbonic anhydrase
MRVGRRGYRAHAEREECDVRHMPYAVASLSTPSILVLGHDSCGAVSATIQSLKDNTTLPGHPPSLVARLASAVRASAGQPGDALDNAIRRNVRDNVDALKSATPLLNAAVEDG